MPSNVTCDSFFTVIKPFHWISCLKFMVFYSCSLWIALSYCFLERGNEALVMYICFLAIFFQPSLVSGRFFQVLFLEQKSLQVEGMFFPDTGITGQPVHIFQLEFFFLLIFTWKIRLKKINILKYWIFMYSEASPIYVFRGLPFYVAQSSCLSIKRWEVLQVRRERDQNLEG